MTDLELAREWIRKTFAHKMDSDADEVLALAALLARVRLDEAKWWYETHIRPWRADDLDMDDIAQRHIAALQQAAGGSAAGSQK